MRYNNMIENKKLLVSDFRKQGYLQELNRQFLHPLGLSLEVLSYEDGHEEFGSIYDYRTDESGIVFDLINSDNARINDFISKANNIKREKKRIQKNRKKLYKYQIEPIKNKINNQINSSI